MLAIEKIDHIRIRVSDKQVSIDFYEALGFKTLDDIGFEQGHPVIMQHPSGVVINLLGPSEKPEANILMDVPEKHAGITHVSFKVTSIPDAKAFLEKNNIEQTGEMTFKGMHAIFFRDPDLNVIELDSYEGDEPDTRVSDKGYTEHP